MNIIYCLGDILEANTYALVNPVNTVGIAGKGLAAQVKKAYPGAHEEYKKNCIRGLLRVGRCLPIFHEGRLIIFLATKKHWRDRSALAGIFAGLLNLREYLIAYSIPSVALPKVGCGNGGLAWKDVASFVHFSLIGIPTKVYVYGEPYEP